MSIQRSISDSNQQSAPGVGVLTRDDLLILLVEECGEVIQAATKCLRFGYDVDHGTGYGNNAAALAKEAGELAAIVRELGLPKADAFIVGITGKMDRARNAKAVYGRTLSEPSS